MQFPVVGGFYNSHSTVPNNSACCGRNLRTCRTCVSSQRRQTWTAPLTLASNLPLKRFVDLAPRDPPIGLGVSGSAPPSGTREVVSTSWTVAWATLPHTGIERAQQLILVLRTVLPSTQLPDTAAASWGRAYNACFFADPGGYGGRGGVRGRVHELVQLQSERRMHQRSVVRPLRTGL